LSCCFAACIGKWPVSSFPWLDAKRENILSGGTQRHTMLARKQGVYSRHQHCQKNDKQHSLLCQSLQYLLRSSAHLYYNLDITLFQKTTIASPKLYDSFKHPFLLSRCSHLSSPPLLVQRFLQTARRRRRPQHRPREERPPVQDRPRLRLQVRLPQHHDCAGTFTSGLCGGGAGTMAVVDVFMRNRRDILEYEPKA
jgi:hypothetical protein